MHVFFIVYSQTFWRIQNFAFSVAFSLPLKLFLCPPLFVTFKDGQCVVKSCDLYFTKSWLCMWPTFLDWTWQDNLDVLWSLAFWLTDISKVQTLFQEKDMNIFFVQMIRKLLGPPFQILRKGRGPLLTDICSTCKVLMRLKSSTFITRFYCPQ